MTEQTNSYPILDAKLQLSNTYLADFDRIARLLNVVCNDHRGRIPQAELAAAVGIADRHAKHLCAIANALGLLEKITYKPTPLGRLVQQHDPFFDDLGTLWFVHYFIGSNQRIIVWNRVVNGIVPGSRIFTREQAREKFADLRQWFTDYSVHSHLLKELNTVLDAYTNQRLTRLAYLRVEDGGFVLGHREPVPALVLAASMAHFRDLYRPGDTAVSIADLLKSQNSPGVVFQIDEDRFRTALEELKTQPGLSLESRADLDQVRLITDLKSHDWMRRYYESRN